ncbi:hypothetical protein Tco_0686541 [Tanacetum coccineum]
MKGIPYASVVGSMYAVRCTRPDVAFSQNLTSRYQQNPGESHWTAIKNNLNYFRNTKDMFLVYGGDSTTELGVTCYTDASWSPFDSTDHATKGETMQLVKQGLLSVITVRVKGIWQVLDEEQLTFLADPRIADCYDIQPKIIYNVAFQTDDLDAYDSDCDDISFAKAILMANLSSYASNVISEVPQHDTYQNDMLNQSVQETHNFQQSLIDYVPDNEITSDSNIISYEQYLQQTQNTIVQDSNSSAQQDSMIMSVFE